MLTKANIQNLVKLNIRFKAYPEFLEQYARKGMILSISHARGLITPIHPRWFFGGHYAKGRVRMVLLTSLRERLDDFSYITREVESFEINKRTRQNLVSPRWRLWIHYVSGNRLFTAIRARGIKYHSVIGRYSQD